MVKEIKKVDNTNDNDRYGHKSPEELCKNAVPFTPKGSTFFVFYLIPILVYVPTIWNHFEEVTQISPILAVAMTASIIPLIAINKLCVRMWDMIEQDYTGNWDDKNAKRRFLFSGRYAPRGYKNFLASKSGLLYLVLTAIFMFLMFTIFPFKPAIKICLIFAAIFVTAASARTITMMNY